MFSAYEFICFYQAYTLFYTLTTACHALFAKIKKRILTNTIYHPRLFVSIKKRILANSLAPTFVFVKMRKRIFTNSFWVARERIRLLGHIKWCLFSALQSGRVMNFKKHLAFIKQIGILNLSFTPKYFYPIFSVNPCPWFGFSLPLPVQSSDLFSFWKSLKKY